MLSQLIVEKIKKECCKRKISINQLAKTAGLKQSTLNSLMQGDVKNPGIVTIQKICSGLMMSLKDFFDDSIFSNID